MPVISPPRYSTTTRSTYLPPTSGTYRSTYSSTTSTTNDRGTSSYTSDITSSYGSRSNYFTLNHRSSLGSSSSTSAPTSKYSGLTNKYLRSSADKELPPTGSSSRYTRGDSRTRDRETSGPSASLRLATTAADLYEKYSPSSYIPKCELSRSRSLSETNKLTKEKTPTKDSYNSGNITGGTTSSLSKVKLCALTSSPPPIPTHLNNYNNNINNNIINYNNKTTGSVTNHNSAYFGLNNNNNYNNNNNNNSNKQQLQQNTTDACIAITNAATSFIIDSFSNKPTKLISSDVGNYTTSRNPINSNQFIQNSLPSSARTKNLYNMKGSSGSMTATTSNDFSSSNNSNSSSNFGGLKDDIGIQTTYKTSYSSNSNSGSTSNKEMLKNEIELVRSQLKSKSSEINNNSHKLLSSSTKSISNNLNNNNNNNNSNNVNNNITSSNSSNHNGHTNGISKITLPVKPLIHSKNSLLIKQNSLSNNELVPNGVLVVGGRHNSVSELEAVTNKVLKSRTKSIPKTTIPSSSSNGSGSGDPIGDDIKFIDTDDMSNERLNRDTLNAIGSTVRLLPNTPATKILKTNDLNYENDKISISSSSLSLLPQPLPNTNIIKNSSDEIQQQNSSSTDSGIDSSNGSSSSSSTWDSTTTTAPINTTAITTAITLMNGNETATTVTTGTGLMTNNNGIRSVSNLNMQPDSTNFSTIDDKISTTTKLIETDFDNSDSYRNASTRNALPPSSERASKYRERERPSLASRTLSDSDSFALSKSAFTSSSSLTDPYDRGTSTEAVDGLCGLRNIGNTCFMNSVLQCLSHTNELTKFLRNQYSPKTTTKDQRILSEFVKLIKDMWSGSRSVTPLELKSAISSKYRMYSGSAQQDAQEFLRFFLDTLHCALNSGTKGEKLEIDDNLSDTKKADLTWEWYSRVENSLVKDLFVGQLKSSLKCTVCGNTSVTFDPFWDLSLPLPSSTTRCKLESCLDLFIKEEVLDGDEMPTCSKCKTRRKSTKTFTIQRFPKYLVIHLKRFSETRWSKLTTIVEFPTGERELDMSPYASSSNTSSSNYTLYGISNHMGSTAGGHYVAVCKHPILKKWHEFNDNLVSDSSDYNLVSSSAYLLFYERS